MTAQGRSTEEVDSHIEISLSTTWSDGMSDARIPIATVIVLPIYRYTATSGIDCLNKYGEIVKP